MIPYFSLYGVPGPVPHEFGVDRAAGLAFLATGVSVLVSLAGDLAVAGPAPEGGWLILVTDDHRETADTAGEQADRGNASEQMFELHGDFLFLMGTRHT